MLRNKNLIPLSHQHQHALALCVRLDRALQSGPVDPEPWQSEITQHFQQEISIHFAAEEREVFPVAERFVDMQALVVELTQEHVALRDFFTRAESGSLDSASLGEFVEKLAKHIRKEERQLFEGLQAALSSDELNALGSNLDKAMAAANDACILQTEATRLRPKS
jgi:hemerythrin-like domain-containing protein